MTPPPCRTPRARNNLWVLSLFALSFVYASRSLWYDLRLINRELLDPDRIRLIFAVYALFLFPFLILVLSREFVAALTKQPAWLFAAIGWYGMIPALIYGNDPVYVLQDLFKLSLVPAGYLAYRLARPGLDVRKFMLFLAGSILLLELARLAIHLAARRAGAGIVYGTIVDVLPVAVFLAFALFSRGAARVPYFLLSALSFGLSLIGQKRTVLACILLLTLFFILWTLRRNAVFVTFCALILLSCVTVLVPSETLDRDLDVSMLRRVTTTDFEKDVGRASVRFAEIEAAFKAVRDRGLFAVLFGCGHGATFELWHPVRGMETVHSVHFTPAAMVYRYGLFGATFFVVMLLLVVRAIFRGTAGGASTASAAAALAARGYLLSATVACFLIYGLVDDLLCGLSFAIVEEETRGRGGGRL